MEFGPDPDPPRRHPAWILLVLASSPAIAQIPVFDLAGKQVGTHDAPGTAGNGAILMTAAAGSEKPAGIYILGAAPDDAGAPPAAVIAASGGGRALFGGGNTLFSDETAGRFPVDTWDIGDLATADLNGDSLQDIVFTLSSSDCDSIPGDRPRIWIQQPDGSFEDETDDRMEAVDVSTRDVDIFDAEGDGDPDILICGYYCTSHYTVVVLFINDGSGHFTEQSVGRIPFLPGQSVFYYAEPGLIDTGGTVDIVVILLDMYRINDPVIRPALLLNDGTGHFQLDRTGRVPTGGAYGFFDLRIGDLTGDGLNDILFMNFFRPDEEKSGQLALLRNTGNGFMVDETAWRLPVDTLRRSRTAAIDDVDLDGDPDILDVGLYYGGNDPQVKLLLNDGSGAFSVSDQGEIAGLSGWFNDARFEKFTGREAPDLFLATVAVGAIDYDRMLVNDGAGRFADSSQLLPPVQDFSVAAGVADCENDGDIDLIIGNSSPIINQPGRNALYINGLIPPVTAVPAGGGDRVGPAESRLLGSYPNPFNGATTIVFRMQRAGDAELTIWNAAGALVDRIPVGPLAIGTHETRWTASAFPSGFYEARLSIDGTVKDAVRLIFVR